MRGVHGIQDRFHAHDFNPHFVCSALLDYSLLTVQIQCIYSLNPGMVHFFLTSLVFSVHLCWHKISVWSCSPCEFIFILKLLILWFIFNTYDNHRESFLVKPTERHTVFLLCITYILISLISENLVFLYRVFN